MIKNRAQIQHPVTGKWAKVNTETGRIIKHKKSDEPFKNVKVIGVNAEQGQKQ